MPVDTTHPKYDSMSEKWKRCRDTISGEDAVKDAGTHYLAPLNTQEEVLMTSSKGYTEAEGYSNYKMRASFYGATKRSHQATLGVVFRKPPRLEMGPSPTAQDFLEDVNFAGEAIEVFVKKLVDQVFTTSRAGILAEPLPNQMYPHIECYSAESIINWRTTLIEGNHELSLVVLQETYEETDPDDEFSIEEKTQYRVLRLTNGICTVELWRETSATGTDRFEQVLEPMALMVRGANLGYIPFCFINTTDLSPDTLDDPPFDALAAVNLSHYRNSADLEHGLHYTAIPTPYAAGFKIGSELYLGSTMAWVTDEPGARAGFLEFTGQGLGSLRATMQDKEDQMASLGSRMLESPKRAVEAADTHRIRSASEQSVVANMVDTVAQGLQRVFTWCADWMLIEVDHITVEFNKDYMPLDMDPQLINALTIALQHNRISLETYVWNLHKGEVLPDDRTVEDELKLIEQQKDKANVLPFTNAQVEPDEEPLEEEEQAQT